MNVKKISFFSFLTLFYSFAGHAHDTEFPESPPKVKWAVSCTRLLTAQERTLSEKSEHNRNLPVKDKERTIAYLKRSFWFSSKFSEEWVIYSLSKVLGIHNCLAKCIKNPNKDLRFYSLEKKVTFDHPEMLDEFSKCSKRKLDNFLNLDMVDAQFERCDPGTTFAAGEKILSSLSEESLQKCFIALILFRLSDAVFRNSGLHFKDGQYHNILFDTEDSMGHMMDIPGGICSPQFLGLKFVEKPFSDSIRKLIEDWNLTLLNICLSPYKIYFSEPIEFTKDEDGTRIIPGYGAFDLFFQRINTLKKTVSEHPSLSIGEILVNYFPTSLCPDIKSLLREGYINRASRISYLKNNFPEKYSSHAYWEKLLGK